jgi:DNA-binding XRE family transcriptional regulator
LSDVVVFKSQIATAGDGAAVRDLEDPEPCGSFRAIECLAVTMNQQKDILDQVFCLRDVPEDPEGYGSDQASIASEKSCQSFSAALANLEHQDFVGNVGLDDVRLGRRIRILRKKRGWTQAEMAERVGIDRSLLADVERGKRNISILNLELIAIGLRVTLSQLLSRL